MNHSFNTEIAEKYGIEEAIIIEHLVFWIQKNIANDKHGRDGLYWTYNSAQAFNEIFPYMSPQKISRILRKLEKLEIIKSGCFNRRKGDRTKWYTIIGRRVIHVYSNQCLKMKNGSDQCLKVNEPIFKNEKSIKDINIPDIKKTYKESDGFINLFPEEIKEDSDFKEAWKEWTAHKKERRNSLTERMVTMTIKQFKNLSVEEMIETVNVSIANGYQGLFPEKAKKSRRV